VHDDTLNASGFANMLAGEFAQLLGESDFSQTGYSEFKNFRVANLSLITIDELEALVSIGVEKSMIEHLEQFTAKDPGRLLYSFGDYLLELPDKKNPKEPLSRVMGRSVLEQARKEFFPTRPPLV
jgi:hypothetical protein